MLANMNHVSSPEKERIWGPELYSVSTGLGLVYVKRLACSILYLQQCQDLGLARPTPLEGVASPSSLFLSLLPPPPLQ